MVWDIIGLKIAGHQTVCFAPNIQDWKQRVENHSSIEKTAIKVCPSRCFNFRHNVFFAPQHFNNAKRVRKALNILLYSIKPERKSGVMGMTAKQKKQNASLSQDMLIESNKNVLMNIFNKVKLCL